MDEHQKNLTFHYDRLLTLLGVIGITLFAGVISGSYPAFFLSAFQPTDVLKGTWKASLKRSTLRRSLVIVQFAISIVLMIGTGVIYAQMDYVRNKDLGFHKDCVIALTMLQTPELRSRYETIKSELSQDSGVLNVAAGSDAPFRLPPGFTIPRWFAVPEGAQPNEGMPVDIYLVDHDFIKTLGMKIVAGRDFSKALATDATEAFVINETAAKAFGWKLPEAAIGKRLAFGNGRRGAVIGVVKDFHAQSLYQRVEPMVLHGFQERLYYVLVRISPDRISSTLDFLKSKWQKFLPDQPFEYLFLDDAFESAHRAAQRTGQVLGSFALLAIFIACLGLFGLASFTAEQRTKEIGIRKVLGASVSNIVLLLSTEFAKLVILSNLIAWPVVYYVMRRWLQEFVYRIELGPSVFVLGGVLALFVALLTVNAQAVMAARANPVDALRYE